MRYKITKITFAWTNKDRFDKDSLKRIGRIVDINTDEIIIGKNAMIRYISDADGSEMRWKALRTSVVKDVIGKTGDEIVIVSTENSNYEFTICEDKAE